MYHHQKCLKRSKLDPWVRVFNWPEKVQVCALRHILTIGYMQNKYRKIFVKKIYPIPTVGYMQKKIQKKKHTYSIQYCTF